MDNYIYINGEKIQINDSQISALRAALEKSTEKNIEKSCFDRVGCGDWYYYITRDGRIGIDREIGMDIDRQCHNVANYCTDRDLLTDRALSETLSRLLWRYSMEHGGDKIDWTKDTEKYYIYYDATSGKFDFYFTYSLKEPGTIYFDSKQIAEKAIEEVVEPFMREHSDYSPFYC